MRNAALGSCLCLQQTKQQSELKRQRGLMMSKVVCVAVLVKEQGFVNKQDNLLGTLQVHMHRSLHM